MGDQSLRRAVRKTEPVFEDGEWWYIRPEGTKTAGKRERIDQYHKNNDVRMFVNGKYIPFNTSLLSVEVNGLRLTMCWQLKYLTINLKRRQLDFSLEAW